MSDVLHYIWLGILAVFQGPALFHLLGFALPAAPFMLFFGLLTGIAVGATPGLAGPMAMAISLPILISVFGFTPDALLPVFGFLIGIMKGATVGGVVPAILFNTPGTPDALMTTLDGHPMARAGQPRRALRIAQISSVAGDTFSDLVLFVCAPFLAILVERVLDLPEKTALLVLSLSFVAAVMGKSLGARPSVRQHRPARSLCRHGAGLLPAAHDGPAGT
jgi:putative tricarboxylic transport membrane protein